MDDIRRILCPVDRSEPSRTAFDVAVLHAAQSGAALTVLEVVETPSTGLGRGAAPGGGVVEALAGGVKPALDRFVQPARDRGVPVAVQVVTGPVARQILRVADELPADLLVMGTHGRAGLQRFLLGSVTERVLQHLRCPALTVPPGVVPALPARVLCATDFSDPAHTAFRHALRVVRQGSGELWLAHVVEWPLGPVSGGDDAVSRLYRSIEGEAREQLEALAADAKAAGVTCEVVVETGRPKTVLMALAESRDADLIVLGATGLNAVQSVFVGSTTGFVVRTARCAVLVAPASHRA